MMDVSVPSDLESAQAKLIYVYLTARQSATADELTTALDIDKGTVLTLTSTLCERGHVTRTGSRYELG
jgi:DNA-binding IclR family transcriptional regulator